MNQRYQAHIDGLRAVAVLSVLLFHLDVPWATGGYVGVDVFFVISGFLITGIIVQEKARTGRFSFANFYVRRIRRIFPALFVTTVLAFGASAYLLSPEHLQQMARSVIAALFSASNILFWHDSGYFDVLAEMKPLLHTWSLSVEEQFYMIWPPIMLVASVLRQSWIVVAVIGVLSFVANFFRSDFDILSDAFSRL